MNNNSLFHTNIFLQQELLLQQMIIFNQMLYQNRTKSLPTPQLQLLKQKPLYENDLSSQLIQKQDETNLVKPISTKSTKQTKSIKKQNKASKSKHLLCAQNFEKQIKETSQKKKIFLSMLDIKEAQYKKIKITENDKLKQPIAVVQEQL
ncbi:unnamed protein product [Paramecium sonneborni]|uniref:Uncharacterized protein n=1 Tax=Paramecium sonneborni TaxID=65129 RepID=A0A8S1KRL8_9CILI|nr:unnamed protein product [Paramecium sonneborni]